MLGVDGGGTKTVAWLGRLVDEKVIRIGAGQGGPSNPRAVGFEVAFQNIGLARELAFEDAGLPTTTVQSACLCLAGTGRPQEMAAVLGWAQQQNLAGRTRLVSEAEAVLSSIQRDDDSQPQVAYAQLALICGTGSLAWGRSSNSPRPVRSGGWGYLLGDEGSGFWLGQQVLQLACKASDGRSSESIVLSQVLNKLNLKAPEELVAWCYEAPESRQRISSLAPLAFEGEPGSSVQDIVDRGASELAQMVSAVVQRLNCETYDLAMAGSILLNQAIYRAMIQSRLENLLHAPTCIHLVEQPVAGALHLASLP